MALCVSVRCHRPTSRMRPAPSGAAGHRNGVANPESALSYGKSLRSEKRFAAVSGSGAATPLESGLIRVMVINPDCRNSTSPSGIVACPPRMANAIAGRNAVCRINES